MNVLIVHAHPDPASMNAALTAAAVRALREAGARVVVSDLYAQHFNAVAGRADFLDVADAERFGYVHEQRHASAQRRYSPDIVAEQDKVAQADLLLFQFPLWWYSVPAILKGWAERVLTHGFAYTDASVFESGLLRGKRALLSVTTGASRAELDADSRYTGTVEEFLRPFTGGVLRFCGMEVLPSHMSYAPAQLGPDGRTVQIQALANRLDLIVPALRPAQE